MNDETQTAGALGSTEGLGAWLPIETAPRDTHILLWGKFWDDREVFQRPLIGIWNYHDEEWFIPGEYRFKVRPSHWHPLPAPPVSA